MIYLILIICMANSIVNIYLLVTRLNLIEANKKLLDNVTEVAKCAEATLESLDKLSQEFRVDVQNLNHAMAKTEAPMIGNEGRCDN